MEKNQKTAFVKSIDPETKTITGYVSTFGWDRDLERFVKGAWDLSNYIKNPVVLWSHDISSPPIARNVDMKEDDLGLLATSEFDSKGETAMGIFSLFERKFLNAFSVGFIRKDFVVEDAGNGLRGLAITKAELYEYSAVSVPANPAATVTREIRELAIKLFAPKVTKGPEDEPKEPVETPETETPPAPTPDEPKNEPVEPTPAAPAPSEPAPAELEPALKQVIELARMAKGNPVSEKQRILLTTAMSVFNEVVSDRKEDLSATELLKLKSVLIEFASVTAEIYPDAAPSIQKTISQIDKAIIGQAA